MILKQSTQEKHNQAEQTAVGAAMADGTISAQWWADWMGAILAVHTAIDAYLPDCLQRTVPLCKDLAQLGIQPRYCPAVTEYVATLTDSAQREGAEYVFTGAHLMGGAIIHKRLADRLPTAHLQWSDRSEAIRLWTPLRDRTDLIGPAHRAFAAVINICEQIQAHDL